MKFYNPVRNIAAGVVIQFSFGLCKGGLIFIISGEKSVYLIQGFLVRGRMTKEEIQNETGITLYCKALFH